MKQKYRKISLVGVLIFIIVLFLFQTKNTSAKSYGMAGCGIGSMIIGPKPGWIQLVASISNNISTQQVTSIASETSNCVENGVIRAEIEQRVFVETNMLAMKTQMAQGEGETINGLAYLMGCDAQYTNQFSEITQKNYSNIFKDKKADFVLYNIKKVVASNKNLLKACKKIWL